MKRFLDRITDGEVLVVDGAMGTMLIARGLPPGACPEEWNLTRPEILEEIASLYLEAGADVITANTFGASPMKLAPYGLADMTEDINAAGVAAVRKVVGDSAYVLGDVGPSGRLLKPYGDADRDEVYRSFERQASALVSAGVDVVFVETMMDLNEATLAVKAVRAVSPDIPIVTTMTFDDTPGGFFTIMGVSVEDAASGLAAAGADVVGSNCGNGIENMVRIARLFGEHTDLPLVIQSNAGLPEVVNGELVYAETPKFMAARVNDLLDAGAKIIGGCCGTTPEHIRAIRGAVDSLVG
ncbi:MAG: homocysteine S-methyltransferase family protein [Candidatus Coatesbacteria bacterium]|nr:MAG: homocysteine S-methyltransferase family protein [Candidatus Coatesbacteria bacterium]